MSESSEPGGGRSRNRRRKVARAPRNAQHWMIVSSLENFRKTQDRTFTIQGIKTRHRRRAEVMKPGDRLLYYVTGRMVFTAVCTLTSAMFEDHTHVWRSTRRDEDYPWRVRIRPDVALEESEWVPAKELAYRLEYVRKWPPEHWTLAFQGHIHQLPQRDFKLIEDEIRRLERARPVAS
ncbi:MAG TPA: EVE domain-containing protein [Candidatus Dormibacteraeota bacterium]|nr:EVE domain-containing protein [Candidatus Dormibacteraeota bacterium]